MGRGHWPKGQGGKSWVNPNLSGQTNLTYSKRKKLACLVARTMTNSVSVFYWTNWIHHLLVSAHQPSSPSPSTSREDGGQSVMFDNMSKGACPWVSQLRQELRAGQGQTSWTDRTKDIISIIIVIFMSCEKTSAHLVCCCGMETMERMKRSGALTRWDWRRAEGRRHF